MKFVLNELKPIISIDKIANVHYFEFSNGYFTQEDKHPFFELIFVVNGELFINSEKFSGVLKKNMMIIHSPNEKHSLDCSEENSPSVIIIGFSCIGNDVYSISDAPISLSDTEAFKLAEIIKEGRNVFTPPYDIPVSNMKKKENPVYGSEQLLKNLLEYFLITLIRKNTFLNQTEENVFVDKFSINEIVSYLDDNFLEKITIAELAFLFHTNRSTICKDFKNFTGKTIISYIDEKKYNSAKEKILNTNKTMTEIADELNFESIHYFTRFFKKMSGVSPNKYRKNNK